MARHAGDRGLRDAQRGFTLIEVLIVVAIIAILVAIAIPVFNVQLEKTREATDTANMREASSMAAAALATGTDADGAELKDGIYYYHTDGGGRLLPQASGNPTPYGKGTEAGDDPEDHTDKWVCAEISVTDGTYVLYWKGGKESTSQSQYSQFFNQYYDADGNPLSGWINTDTTRTAVWNANGGTWKSITFDGKTYYMQPNKPRDIGCILYATPNNSLDDRNAWNGAAVYYDGTWYKRSDGGNIGTANLTKAQATGWIEDGTWVAVTNYTTA